MGIKLGKWTIKPEIEDPMYWVHIGVILFVVNTLMNLNNPGNNFMLWGLYLGISDIISHTLLSID